MLVELVPGDAVDHEAQGRVGVELKVGLARLGDLGAREPLVVGLAVEELDARALLAARRVREVRVEEGHVAEGGYADGIVDRRSDLLGGGRDAVERRDDPARRERRATAARREGDLGVAADDGDALALGRRAEREETRVVLEKDGRVGGRLAKERAQLGRVDLVFAGVERDARVDGKVEEVEDVAHPVVDVVGRELAGAARPVDGAAAHDGRAGHLDVEAGLDRLVDRVDARPVRHDEAVPAPVAAQDAVEELLALRAVLAVEAVVARHEGLRVRVLDGEAEGLEVDLAEGALRDDTCRTRKKRRRAAGGGRGARGRVSDEQREDRRCKDALSMEKRSNSWSLATKCLMQAATPLPWRPLMYSAATVGRQRQLAARTRSCRSRGSGRRTHAGRRGAGPRCSFRSLARRGASAGC